MALTLGIIFGLLAMLGWGIADFFAKKAVNKVGPYRTFFYSHSISFILVLIYFIFFPNTTNLTLLIIFLFLIETFFNAIGFLCFYKGIKIEKLSIISPIVACNPIIVVILSFIFLNEILNLNQYFGIGLMIIGLIFVSIQGKFKVENKKGVYMALLAMLGWGVATFMFGYLVKQSNWVAAIFLARLFTWLWGFLFFKLKKVSLSFPKIVFNYILLMALLELVGIFSFSFGVVGEKVSIIGPIAALYPAVTLIMARIFLKEKLILYQKIGAIGILIGLILVSL